MRYFNSQSLMNALVHATKSLLALSAAVSLKVLDTRDSDGNYLYARGRYKYFGIGSLVIFFALFAGYGMAHMLATMANVSSTGAIVAGCLWAVFQWCLERQMIMSINSDASWAAKSMGLFWRSLLALLSAITMVYPFYVDSNRAEITYKTGELERSRLIHNLQSAQQATGLPALQQDVAALDDKLQKAEDKLLSEPPQMADMRQQLQSLREQAKTEERRSNGQIANWRKAMTVALPAEAVLLEQKISAAQNRINAARARCQRQEQEINATLITWRKEKIAEKAQLAEERQQANTIASKARTDAQALEKIQSAHIQAASHAGFAADFAATWDMLQNDVHRRLQFIWWLLWFLTIELVAIIVKFTSHTDVDARLNADEYLLKLGIASNSRVRQAHIEIEQLRELTALKGEQAALQADAGISAAALATIRRMQQLEQQAALSPGNASSGLRSLLQDTLNTMNANFLRLLENK
ncbi:DUF4407 domain-containing protein [Undibacterium pigrum]|uniref:Uncharacterized protein DUF4407 n=1 Tax=Undibacterium pigrum TaxID=401470 RepID=A0A318J4B9_9BURK|nr:DUF4407 domain-containing protein [Undibacterium pigrum]PXX42618.1 uncharacterized protein DUF4407 [Undibacterium pigrum]